MFLKDHVPVTFGEMAFDEKTWSLSFDLTLHEKDGERISTMTNILAKSLLLRNKKKQNSIL